jgi:nucleotide-binding universal stress UspA family protein
MPTIVVGYDGSPPAEAALARGIERVAAGGRLLVIHAWLPPRILQGSTTYGVLAAGSYERAELELERLAETHPGLAAVQWDARLVEGSAPKALAALAHDVGADEIIVGSSGAGRAGALLGSVAHGLLHTAACPVTVIPRRFTQADGADPPGAEVAAAGDTAITPTRSRA